jgi:acyl-CoA dehydrogenase
VMGLCGSHCTGAPAAAAPETRRYYQQLTRFSAVLAFLSDVSMGSLGGALKRKEKLSARLGDILSMLYLCSATLKRYETDGRQAGDAPLMHWAIWDAMFKAQSAIEGVISNFPNRLIAWVLRRLVFPLGRPYVVPSDQLGHTVAKLLIEPSATRDRLTAGMFISSSEENPVGAIELALAATLAAEPVEGRIRDAIKAGRLALGARDDRVAAAQAAGVITPEQATAVRRAQRLVDKVVRVDDFPPDLGASDIRAPKAIAHKAAA